MNEEIRWSAMEFEHTHKSNDWYWVVGIVAVGFAIVSIIFENLLFAIFILVAVFALVIQSARKPISLDIRINGRGISIGTKLYPFNTLASFWIEKTEDKDTLLIRSKKTIMPYLVIPIQNANVSEIEEFLSNFLEEEELHEPLSQKIMERLGF